VVTGRHSYRAVWRHHIVPWLYFLPVISLVFMVTFYPAVNVLWLSLQHTRFYQPLGFIGWANYARIVRSLAFWRETETSLVYVVGTLCLVLPGGIASAILLQRFERGRGILRTVTLLPWTLSMGTTGVIWLWLLNPSYGPVQYGMQRLGLGASLLLGDPRLALPLLIVVTAWWSFPFAMVLTSAALQSVPRELYEAANMDGGGPWVSFRFITLPVLTPALQSAALNLSILYMTLVTLILVLTGGGPLGITETWSFSAFRNGFQTIDVSAASALSVIVLIANLLLGTVYTLWGGAETRT
jgi:multiple sugar transport system permease protein